MRVTFTHSTWSKLFTGFILNPEPDQIIIFAVATGKSGIEPLSRVMQDLIYGSLAPTRFGREMIRAKDQEEGGPFFDWSPVYRYYIF